MTLLFPGGTHVVFEKSVVGSEGAAGHRVFAIVKSDDECMVLDDRKDLLAQLAREARRVSDVYSLIADSLKWGQFEKVP